MRSAAVKGAAIAATAAVLVLAAVASGAKYEGQVAEDPGARVTLRVEGHGSDRTVVGFKVKNLLISCDGADARLHSAALDGEATVGKRGRFVLKGDDPDLKMAIKGKLIGGGEAEGVVTYSGRTTVGETEVDCTSGKQAWNVAR